MTPRTPSRGPAGTGPATPSAAAIAEQMWLRRNRPVDLIPPGDPVILTLRVSVTDSEPEIWRRLEVAGALTLDRLHLCLQEAMGWTDSHLHRFGAAGVNAWDPPWFVTPYDEDEEGDEGTPESSARVDQVLRAEGEWLIYTYDFGDDWIHRVELEAVRAHTDGDAPARCLAGEGACPPEDAGGIHQWNDLAAALRANPDPHALRGDLKEYADWLPDGLHPDSFDVSAADARLGALSAQLTLPAPHPLITDLLAHTDPSVRAELLDLLLAIHRGSTGAVTDEDWAQLLRPWQLLLDLANPGGIPLTEAGWISPAVCERLWIDGELSSGYGRGNREQNTPEVAMLREDAMAARLIRRYKGRLVLTPLGRKAVRDREVLRAALAAYMLEHGEPFDHHGAALALLLIAGGGLRDAQDGFTLSAEVDRLLIAVGWRTSSPHGFRYGVPGSHRVERVLDTRRPGPGRRGMGYAAATLALARQAIFPIP